MCRNIRTLANFAPPATAAEIRASSLQFVRKLSGANEPSKANEALFCRAVDEVAAAAERLIHGWVTGAAPRDRGRRDPKVERAVAVAFRPRTEANADRSDPVARSGGEAARVGDRGPGRPLGGDREIGQRRNRIRQGRLAGPVPRTRIRGRPAVLWPSRGIRGLTRGGDRLANPAPATLRRGSPETASQRREKGVVRARGARLSDFVARFTGTPVGCGMSRRTLSGPR